MNFTPKQLDNWRAYERVRKRGRWNMYDPRARYAARLSAAEYAFVMDNFTELKEKAEKP